MTVYDVGDAPTVSTVFYDLAGDPTDATVVLTVTAPDGTATTSTPTSGGVGTGAYSSVVPITAAGTWKWRFVASGALIAVDEGQFTAADPAPPAYATLAQLKDNLPIPPEDAADDDKLLRVLFTVSRQIDQMCNRPRGFWLATTATARTFNPAGRLMCGPEGERFAVDEIGSLTGLVVEIGSVGGTYTTTTDWEPWPDTVLGNGRPIESLLHNYTWGLSYLSRVRVTARWGWPAIPEQITEATLLQAGRIFRRRLSPDGLAGHSEFGAVRVGRADPDVPALLAPFKLLLVA